MAKVSATNPCRLTGKWTLEYWFYRITFVFPVCLRLALSLSGPVNCSTGACRLAVMYRHTQSSINGGCTSSVLAAALSSTDNTPALMRLGIFLGTHPYKCIIAAVILCGLCACGLIQWHEELDDVELFMPKDSPLRKDAAWVNEHFNDDILYPSIIVEADNVLDPSVLAAIAEVEMALRKIRVNGRGWEDICTRYQTWFETAGDTATGDFDELLGSMDLSSFPNDCIYQSLLKFWMVDGHFEPIFELQQKEVLDLITKKIGARPKTILEDVNLLLSGVSWSNDSVTGAKATILSWMIKKSDEASHEWEKQFLDEVLRPDRKLPPGMKIYAAATRSYKDVLGEVLENNKTLLFAGFSLVIAYVILMLGKFNSIQQRVVLSLLGVGVVGLSIAASYGLCFLMGFFWGPLHPTLPFLLLGVGVDNTYVVVQCLDNLVNREKIQIPDRIGRTLQLAGVSITVTSVTDILAFAVGTSTVMPFLRSFCVFSAVGIFSLYIFEILFFVACLAIDEKRMSENRDYFYRRCTNTKPNECSQLKIQQAIFTKYIAPILMKPVCKIIAFSVTILIFAANIWCLTQVERKFDPIWYLNQDSYPIKFNDKLNEYFPKYGKRSGIYMAGIDYHSDKKTLLDLANNLRTNPYINKASLDIWFEKAYSWMQHKNYDADNDEEFKQYLREFILFTTPGQAYIKDLRFRNFYSIDYDITVAKVPIQFIVLNTTHEQVMAMNSINSIIGSFNYTREDQRIVSFSPEFIPWTANMIIGEELLRNLAITIVAVGVVTLILIQDLQTTFFVNTCVIFTVVDLIGTMYWLGLTIEISTSLMILLCAGLAVDYAVHIGQEFTRLEGTRTERAAESVSNIGCAIFNGGFSTFLAFSLLGLSDSYLFTTFFKLFTFVVVYGVFHGIIYLPVILSWLGPAVKSSSQGLVGASVDGQCPEPSVETELRNLADLPTEPKPKDGGNV